MQMKVQTQSNLSHESHRQSRHRRGKQNQQMENHLAYSKLILLLFHERNITLLPILRDMAEGKV